MALFMGPLNFSKLVYISVIASTSYSSVEEKNPSSSLQLYMKAKDFEYVLTWKTRNNTRMPTCFNVMYSSPSLETTSNSPKKDEGQDASSSKSRFQQKEDPDHPVLQPEELPVCPSMPEKSDLLKKYRIVTGCSNITRPFCNLTKEFTDPEIMYSILVQQVTENEVTQSMIYFTPYLNTCLGQPQFNVSSCPNCVNVMVELSSPLLPKVYRDIRYTIKMSTPGFPDKRDDNTSKQESFSVVMGNLLPNRNYCIAVDVSTNLNKQCKPSSSKCIITESKNKSDNIISSVFSAIFLSLLTIGILLVLYKAGLICLRTDWPNFLNIIPKCGYSVFDSVPEEVHSVKVTEKTKKKVWHCEDDDGDDDYNDDSGSDVENNHLYTVRKHLKNSSTVDIVEQLSIDSSSSQIDTSQSGIAEAVILQNEINQDRSTTTEQLLYDSSKGDVTNEPELELSSCLNVNLNSVKLGITIDTQDVPASRDPDHEDSADVKEPCITSDSESTHFTDIPNVQTPNVHSLFSTWQNPGGSEESESSGSETDYVGDYIQRGQQ
nr:interferon alpha/beta receptor 2 isoform X1 [Anolis sagrei ordinatus]XP_060626381.1 interferon alpha/beta receptor 2 isoform X1 [Anolis sagrei ordinatus]XP_060626382.1 interferon alpha/beta receptor 2 isoform X1 [Anolis sagrei ordinatus]XP_060626383.1 interferon alpha/beta receptor 2 isoform X1 [Anolis sagrei ordinatus]